MATIKEIIAVLCLILALAFGCSGSPKVSGHWIGKRNLPMHGSDTVVYDQLMKVDLAISMDGKARLYDGGIPKEGHLESIGPDKFSLVIDAVMNLPAERAYGIKGQDPNRRIEIKLLENGDLTFVDPNSSFDPTPVLLKRETQPTP